jgi:inhibitor of growth protein 3
MPSMLVDSPGNMVPLPSANNTGANTPLHPVSGNQPGGAGIAQAAVVARLSNAANVNARANPSALQTMQTQALLNQQRLANQQIPLQQNALQEREGSTGGDSRRQRPSGSLGTLPPRPSSQLTRQPSMTPGTPKPSTPGSRAGSVGPRSSKHPMIVKKSKPHHPPGLRKAALIGTKSGTKKSKQRKDRSSRASPSTTADDESVQSEAGTEDEEMSGVGHEEDESDDTKYCFCQRVSFGDMVACDNDDCQYQWFHWECVNIKEEPVGDWLCPDCRAKPSKLIKRVR